MADPHVEQPSPDRKQRAPARGFVVDPEERPVPLLSSEPPPRKMSPAVKRKLAAAKKACIILVAALFGLILLAFIAETPDEPVRTPTQSPSMRG